MSLRILQERLSVAGNLLSDGEDALAEACSSLLLRLSDPLDLPPGEAFFDAGTAYSAELCARAAKAAMAVLLADPRMQLPAHIETAYDMPEVV